MIARYTYLAPLGGLLDGKVERQKVFKVMVIEVKRGKFLSLFFVMSTTFFLIPMEKILVGEKKDVSFFPPMAKRTFILRLKGKPFLFQARKTTIARMFCDKRNRDVFFVKFLI